VAAEVSESFLSQCPEPDHCFVVSPTKAKSQQQKGKT